MTILPSLIHHGSTLSERYPEEVRFIELPPVFPPNTRPAGWNVIFDLSRSSVAALMFRSENKEAFAMILTVKGFGVSVDVAVAQRTENPKDLLDKDPLFLQRARRCSRQLQVKLDVRATG